MNPRNVISLDKVIGIDFPIGIKDQGSSLCPVALLDWIFLDLTQEPTQLVGQRSTALQTGKDQPAPERYRNRM